MAADPGNCGDLPLIMPVCINEAISQIYQHLSYFCDFFFFVVVTCFSFFPESHTTCVVSGSTLIINLDIFMEPMH